MIARRKLLSLVVLLALVPLPALAELDVSNYEGWAVTVLSGDTLRVLDGSNRMTRVRLKSIDAPEKNQPYGAEARKFLASLVSGREVKVEAKNTDDFGNILGQIWVEPPKCFDCKKSVDANLALLKAGLAWWSSKFAKQQSRSERKEYEAAQDDARRKMIGLWADPDPIPPWEWRERETTTEPDGTQDEE